MRRIPLLAVALSALCGLAAAHAGEVYQWKDANGVTHYSQTPPPQGQYRQRQITHAGTTAPQASSQPDPSHEKPQCATARANLEVLESGQPVQELGEDGKPGRVLNEAEHNRQLELANAAVRAYCQPAS
jgi:hypothetical protein